MIAFLERLLFGSAPTPPRFSYRAPTLHAEIVAAHKAEHEAFAAKQDWATMMKRAR